MPGPDRDAAAPEAPLADRIEAALGRRPLALVPLSGGSTVRVLRADLPGGERIVAKAGRGQLALERRMLDALARYSDLPLPTVLHGADDLLLMTHVDHDGGAPGAAAQAHAAELLAALHATPRERFGYERAAQAWCQFLERVIFIWKDNRTSMASPALTRGRRAG